MFIGVFLHYLTQIGVCTLKPVKRFTNIINRWQLRQQLNYIAIELKELDLCYVSLDYTLPAIFDTVDHFYI